MRVLARIELLSTEAGGRAESLRGSFRLNHKFGKEGFAIGQVTQAADAELAAGQAAELIVTFIGDRVPALEPGTRWEIFDGPSYRVGTGEVLELLG